MDARNTSNQTLSAIASNLIAVPLQPIWPGVFVGELTALIFLLLFNGLVLLVYVIKKSLRTSFTVYVMALLSSNILYGMTRNLLDVVNGVYGTWWTGHFSCDLYLYSNWVVYGYPPHCHILITINRIWAISYPISYRRYHTKKTAVALCALMALYIHLVTFPGYMLDALFYRMPIAEDGCSLNAVELKTHLVMNLFLIGDFPIVFVVCACPILLYQQRLRIRRTGPGETFSPHGTSKRTDGIAHGPVRPECQL